MDTLRTVGGFRCCGKKTGGRREESVKRRKLGRTDEPSLCLHTLLINVGENNITLDGSPLDIEIIQNTSFIPHGNTMISNSTNWVYSGTRNINIVAEDAIKNLAVSTLLTLMLSAMGGFGVILSVVQSVWDTYQDLNSDTVYATRTTYFEEHYWAYKFLDKYYSDSARTNLIDSNSTEHWE